MYDVNNLPIWDSKSQGNGPSTLVADDTGNLTLRRDSDNAVTWSSNSGAKLPPAQPAAVTDKLVSGQAIWRGRLKLTSPNGAVTLTLQPSDGNLVLYQGTAPLWASAKPGLGAWATVQGDGNFVVYTSAGDPLWNSGTFGNGPSTLTVRDNGDLVLTRDSDGAVTWDWRNGRH